MTFALVASELSPPRGEIKRHSSQLGTVVCTYLAHGPARPRGRPETEPAAALTRLGRFLAARDTLPLAALGVHSSPVSVVLCRILHSVDTEHAVADRVGRIVRMLRRRKRVTSREVAQMVGTSVRTAQRYLSALERQGLVEREPVRGSSGRRFVWVWKTNAGTTQETTA